jgi:hypothetical protein
VKRMERVRRADVKWADFTESGNGQGGGDYLAVSQVWLYPREKKRRCESNDCTVGRCVSTS